VIELADPPIRKRQQILYHVKALAELERQIARDNVSDETAKDWHAWVYGWGKNPQL